MQRTEAEEADLHTRRSQFMFGAKRAGKKLRKLKEAFACPVCRQKVRVDDDSLQVRGHREEGVRCEGEGMKPLVLEFQPELSAKSAAYLNKG